MSKSQKKRNEQTRLEAKLAQGPEESKTERDLQAASTGLVTPLQGAELLPPEQRPDDVWLTHPANPDRATETQPDHTQPAVASPDGQPKEPDVPAMLNAALDAERDAQDARAALEPPPAIVPDQSAPAKDQTSGRTKSGKKESPTVIAWRKTKAFDEDCIITIIAKDNPKRKNAGVRFSWYIDGMTVKQYKDLCVQKGSSKSLAVADIRWDHAAGFIRCEKPREEA